MKSMVIFYVLSISLATLAYGNNPSVTITEMNAKELSYNPLLRPITSYIHNQRSLDYVGQMMFVCAIPTIPSRDPKVADEEKRCTYGHWQDSETVSGDEAEKISNLPQFSRNKGEVGPNYMTYGVLNIRCDTFDDICILTQTEN